MATSACGTPNTRGTTLGGLFPFSSLGGVTPFPVAVAQPQYWVDPTWDWQVLDYDNYLEFLEDTVKERNRAFHSRN